MLCMVYTHFEMGIDFAADKLENGIVRHVWNMVSIEGCSRENVLVNRFSLNFYCGQIMNYLYQNKM